MMTLPNLVSLWHVRHWGGWIRTSGLLINREAVGPKTNRTTGHATAHEGQATGTSLPDVPGFVPGSDDALFRSYRWVGCHPWVGIG